MTGQFDNEAERSAVRLRVRMASALGSQNNEERFRVGDRDAVVVSPQGEALANDPWTIIKVRGFCTEKAASEFGTNLVRALQIVAVKERIGIDTGENRATSNFGESIKEMYAKHGVDLHPNVHGLYIHPDKDDIKFLSVSGAGSTTFSHSLFLDKVADVFHQIKDLDNLNGLNSVLLLNDALLQTDEVGRLALSIAAVEALGHKEAWSCDQHKALERLAAAAEQDHSLNEVEREEIANAIRRSYKIGVMESIRRIFRRLELQDLSKPWNKLYSSRSSIFHGLAYKPRSERAKIVDPAISMCGRIVLTALAAEVPGATDTIDDRYPLTT